MNSRDAPSKTIGGIENRPICIGDLSSQVKELSRNVPAALMRLMTLLQQLHRLPGPDRPLPQKSSDDPALNQISPHLETVRRKQIEENVIIIASV